MLNKNPKLVAIIAAIAVFMVITVTYFQPVLSGKQIRQGDIANHIGMSKEIVDFRKANNGQEPLWTNSMFGGMPAYQISVFYHNNLMKYVDSVFTGFLPHPIGNVFLYFLGFFILLLCLKVDPWIALIASVGYGFSSYFFIIIEAGHNSKAHAIGYMAPLLGAIILTLNGNWKLGGALTALFGSLELYCNHIQITYYLFLLVAILGLFYFYHAVKEKKLKPFFLHIGVIIVAMGFAVLPNITNLWATYEYGKFSTRGKSELTIKANGQSNAEIKTSGLDKDYATQWSYGVGETFTILIPNFKGGASEPLGMPQYKDALNKVDPQSRQYAANFNAYYGDQPFTSGPVYIGAILVFLAILGLFLVEGPLKWALLIGTILSIALSWGKNFMGLTNVFFDFVPGYNKFRAVSMILVIAELTIPLLAALALNRIIQELKSSDKISLKLFKKEIDTKKALFISGTIVGGFALLCWLVPTMFTDFQAAGELQQLIREAKQSEPGVSEEQVMNVYGPVLQEVEKARIAIFKSDAMRTFIFIALTLGGLLLYLQNKVNKQLLLVAIGIFILADMWPVAWRYLNKENFVSKSQAENPFSPSKADEFILQDKDPDYRVLNLAVNTFNNSSTSYFHKSIGGYHGAKLKKYQEMVDFHIDRDIETLYRTLRAGGVTDSSIRAAFYQTQVLNMLNTRYVIINNEAPPLINPYANGNAWFVKDFVIAQNADEEITKTGEINTRTSCVIDQRYADKAGQAYIFDSTASIKLDSYQPNYLVYSSDAKTEQLAVFSEIYYPKGWNAYVDGNPAEHFCANYILRAMKVPAGKHKIEFKFEPAVYQTGEKIALAGSLLIFAVVGAGLFFTFRKKES